MVGELRQTVLTVNEATGGTVTVIDLLMALWHPLLDVTVKITLYTPMPVNK